MSKLRLKRPLEALTVPFVTKIQTYLHQYPLHCHCLTVLPGTSFPAATKGHPLSKCFNVQPSSPLQGPVSSISLSCIIFSLSWLVYCLYEWPLDLIYLKSKQLSFGATSFSIRLLFLPLLQTFWELPTFAVSCFLPPSHLLGTYNWAYMFIKPVRLGLSSTAPMWLSLVGPFLSSSWWLLSIFDFPPSCFIFVLAFAVPHFFFLC